MPEFNIQLTTTASSPLFLQHPFAGYTITGPSIPFSAKEIKDSFLKFCNLFASPSLSLESKGASFYPQRQIIIRMMRQGDGGKDQKDTKDANDKGKDDKKVNEADKTNTQGEPSVTLVDKGPTDSCRQATRFNSLSMRRTDNLHAQSKRVGSFRRRPPSAQLPDFSDKDIEELQQFINQILSILQKGSDSPEDQAEMNRVMSEMEAIWGGKIISGQIASQIFGLFFKAHELIRQLDLNNSLAQTVIDSCQKKQNLFAKRIRNWVQELKDKINTTKDINQLLTIQSELKELLDTSPWLVDEQFDFPLELTKQMIEAFLESTAAYLPLEPNPFSLSSPHLTAPHPGAAFSGSSLPFTTLGAPIFSPSGPASSESSSRTLPQQQAQTLEERINKLRQQYLDHENNINAFRDEADPNLQLFVHNSVREAARLEREIRMLREQLDKINDPSLGSQANLGSLSQPSNPEIDLSSMSIHDLINFFDISGNINAVLANMIIPSAKSQYSLSNIFKIILSLILTGAEFDPKHFDTLFATLVERLQENDRFDEMIQSPRFISLYSYLVKMILNSTKRNLILEHLLKHLPLNYSMLKALIELDGGREAIAPLLSRLCFAPNIFREGMRIYTTQNDPLPVVLLDLVFTYTLQNLDYSILELTANTNINSLLVAIIDSNFLAQPEYTAQSIYQVLFLLIKTQATYDKQLFSQLFLKLLGKLSGNSNAISKSVTSLIKLIFQCKKQSSLLGQIFSYLPLNFRMLDTIHQQEGGPVALSSLLATVELEEDLLVDAINANNAALTQFVIDNITQTKLKRLLMQPLNQRQSVSDWLEDNM